MSSYDRIALVPTAGEAEVLRVAARSAEDAGDFAGALRLVRGLPEGVGPTDWAGQLEVAAGLSPAAPELAGWLVNSALRWALERPVGQLLEGYGRLMLTTLGASAAERNARLTEVCVHDPVVIDAGLFDEGLFDRYLHSAVAPALLERARSVGGWSRCPASIYEFGVQASGRVHLHDCFADQQIACRAWPGSHELSCGELLYGRLVPVSRPAGHAFALGPTRVDPRCASRVLMARRRGAGPEERIRAVARSRRREATCDVDPAW